MIQEELLKVLRSERKEREEGWIYASEVGNCPLSVALRLNDYDPRFSDEDLLTMFVGTAIHEAIQRRLGLEYAEWSLKDEELKLAGHPDGMLNKILIELKSISPFAMKYAKEMPYAHHKVQVSALVHLLRKNKIGCIGSIIEYIDKSSGLFLECEGQEGAVELMRRIAEIRHLEEALKTGTVIIDRVLPFLTIREGKEPWECTRCAMKQVCPIYPEIKKLVTKGKENQW